MSTTETVSVTGERLQELEASLEKLQAAAEAGAEPVKAEAVPEDTQAELERVKHVIGQNFGIDMRSPGQVKQAEIDELEAQIELVKAEQEAEQQAEADALAAGVEADVAAAAPAVENDEPRVGARKRA